MNPLASRDRRRAAAAILCGLCLALSTVAWPWLRAAVLSPLALIVWLFLRVLVLSIHQAVYWTVLVAAVPILLAVALHRRLLLQPPAAPGAPPPRPLPIDDWHWVVAQTADGTPDLPSMGWDGFVRLAVERGARTVELTSRPSREAANRLYQRLGFVEWERIEYRYTPDAGTQPADPTIDRPR